MKLLFASIVLLFVNACATVREVKTRPNKGGELALNEGLFGKSADEKAAEIMEGNCRRGYKIVEKGETVIGSTTSHSANTSSKTKSKGKSSGNAIVNVMSGETDGESSTTGSSDTTDKTEFRIKYQCRKKGEKVSDDD